MVAFVSFNTIKEGTGRGGGGGGYDSGGGWIVILPCMAKSVF